MKEISLRPPDGNSALIDVISPQGLCESILRSSTCNKGVIVRLELAAHHVLFVTLPVTNEHVPTLTVTHHPKIVTVLVDIQNNIHGMGLKKLFHLSDFVREVHCEVAFLNNYLGSVSITREHDHRHLVRELTKRRVPLPDLIQIHGTISKVRDNRKLATRQRRASAQPLHCALVTQHFGNTATDKAHPAFDESCVLHLGRLSAQPWDEVTAERINSELYEYAEPEEPPGISDPGNRASVHWTIMSQTQQLAVDMVDPEPIRFLDAEGRYAPSASAAEYADELAGVGIQEIQEWYRAMVNTRTFDTEATHLQRQGQLALWVPSVGQEGCQVGLAHAIEPQDHIFPAYREHAVAHVRGVDFVDILRLFRGFTHGGWDVTDPANGNFHLYTLVLGSQAHHATGFALAQVLDAKAKAGDTALDAGEAGTATGEATMVFYGDGTSSQGDPNEAMVFAASYQTPEVFVVQNNGWAISVPVERQSRTPLYRRALGFGIRSVQIDGNDPLAAYAVGKRFMRLAREGHGPGYIEALTYRIGAHTTSDDPTRYREAEELELWRRRDPIERLENYLREQGVTDDFFDEVAKTADTEAKRVRDVILAAPAPDADSMFAHVYTEPHPRIEEQRAWLDHYESSFEEQAE